MLYGPGEPFQLEDIPDPIAGYGEVVVKVITCGAGLTIQHVKSGRVKVQYPVEIASGADAIVKHFVKISMGMSVVQ